LIPEDQKDTALEHLEQELPDRAFDVDEGLGMVSIIGPGLCSRPGITRQVLAALDSIEAKPETVSTSGITMTILLDKGQVLKAVRRLHSDLGLAEPALEGESG
jgi:aspartokinase